MTRAFSLARPVGKRPLGGVSARVGNAWKGIGGGLVAAYDFSLLTAGGTPPAEFIYSSGAGDASLITDGVTSKTALRTVTSAAIAWDGALGATDGFMEVVTLTRHGDSPLGRQYDGPALYIDPVTPATKHVWAVRRDDSYLRVSAEGYTVTSTTSAALPVFWGWGLLRARYFEGRLQARRWEKGTAEPAEWQVDFAQALTPTAGLPGVANQSPFDYLHTEWVGVSYDPETAAPLPGEITPSNA